MENFKLTNIDVNSAFLLLDSNERLSLNTNRSVSRSIFNNVWKQGVLSDKTNFNDLNEQKKFNLNNSRDFYLSSSANSSNHQKALLQYSLQPTSFQQIDQIKNHVINNSSISNHDSSISDSNNKESYQKLNEKAFQEVEIKISEALKNLTELKNSIDNFKEKQNDSLKLALDDFSNLLDGKLSDFLSKISSRENFFKEHIDEILNRKISEMEISLHYKINASLESILKEYAIAELNRQNLNTKNDKLDLSDCQKTSVFDQNLLNVNKIAQHQKEGEKAKKLTVKELKQRLKPKKPNKIVKNFEKKVALTDLKKTNSELNKFNLSQNDSNEIVKTRHYVNYDKIFNELIENSNKTDEFNASSKYYNKANDTKLNDKLNFGSNSTKNLTAQNLNSNLNQFKNNQLMFESKSENKRIKSTSENFDKVFDTIKDKPKTTSSKVYKLNQNKKTSSHFNPFDSDDDLFLLH